MNRIRYDVKSSQYRCTRCTKDLGGKNKEKEFVSLKMLRSREKLYSFFFAAFLFAMLYVYVIVYTLNYT